MLRNRRGGCDVTLRTLVHDITHQVHQRSAEGDRTPPQVPCCVGGKLARDPLVLLRCIGFDGHAIGEALQHRASIERRPAEQCRT